MKIKTTKTTRQDGEFRVRLFIDGVYQAGADYFTDDKEDAQVTAAMMVKNGTETDKTTDFAKSEQADFDGPASEESVAVEIVTSLIAQGYELQHADECETTVSWTKDDALIIAELNATGLDYIKARKGDQRGTLLLVWGNAEDGSELIADYSYNGPEIDTVFNNLLA